MAAELSRGRGLDCDCLWRCRHSARTVVPLGGGLGSWPPAPAYLGRLDLVSCPRCDEADTWRAHGGARRRRGARATLGV